MKKELFLETSFGGFSADGKEYLINTPMTPRPWVNIICPGEYGMAVSNTGSGYSWFRHASMSRITRWSQDLILDNWGKYIYLKDEDTCAVWSPSYMPGCKKAEGYETRHGIGYSVIKSGTGGIFSELTMYVPFGKTHEIWILKLRNNSGKKRRIRYYTYLEWCLGQPDAHREFHKLFFDLSAFPEKGMITARKNLWEIKNDRGESWNREFDMTGFLFSPEKSQEYCVDKESFFGRNRNPHQPEFRGFKKEIIRERFADPIGSISSIIELNPGDEKEIVFALGAAPDTDTAVRNTALYKKEGNALIELEETKKKWFEKLSVYEIRTQDKALDLMTNYWLKYQTLSSRINGRTAYYQAGGAYGFRDQLQDSMIHLLLEPGKTREAILRHAGKQFSNGMSLHWWHPITEEGHKSNFSDDYLWLPLILSEYLKETADFGVLKEKVKYLDKGEGSVLDHCLAAIDTALSRRSKRGLFLIGEGDWNDGLSTCGTRGKGESVWLSFFIYRIISEMIKLNSRVSFPALKKRVSVYEKELKKIKGTVLKLGFNGRYFIGATTDSGQVLGDEKSKGAKIFLNCQSWAVISGMFEDKDFLAKIMKLAAEKLYRASGPLLLSPAYSVPDETVGYLTRYSPGSRENGGVYTHAANWAVIAECLLGNRDKAWKLLMTFFPPEKGKEAEKYYAEPYVTPGNVDGPDSPNYGRAGWTWYTGSSQWMQKTITDYLIGIRADYEGLMISPCLPEGFGKVSIKRQFRARILNIEIIQGNENSLTVNGKKIEHGYVPVSAMKTGENRITVKTNG